MRCEDRESLVARTATLLLDSMRRRQHASGSVSLSLTGGDLANEVYDHVALAASDSAVKASDVHLWWNWDFFVATDNPDRNSLQALSRLAGVWSLDPAKIHPIPSSSVSSDPEAGAAQYVQEMAENPRIDICLLELRPDGRVAGIFPRHLDPPSSAWAVGVTDASMAHRELVTLTRAGLNACTEIWIMASGEDVADAVRSALAGDLACPASHLTGAHSVMWLVDEAAVADVSFHHCTL